MQDSIKIRWTGDARTKLVTRGFEPAVADGMWDEDVFDMFNRQKTNIVIESEQELNAALYELYYMNGRDSQTCTWMAPAHERAFRRVYNELKEEAEDCGIELTTTERGVSTVDANE